jgi:DNA-binding transcriptional ArsR family regulator
MNRAKAKVKGLAERVLRASTHPLRLDIQCILFNRVSSPNRIAKELGEDVSTICHHIDVLEGDGVIELVRTEPRRGAVEHFYKAIVPARHSDSAWARLSKPARRSITTVTLRGVIGEAMRAVTHDTFDARKDRHLSWLPLQLDEQGWEELRDKMAAWLGEVERIKRDAAERLDDSEEAGSRFFASLMAFETPPGLGLTPSDEIRRSAE